jgi:serine/threonine-protein kinase
VVLPEGATVEVDGAPAKPIDGAIEITGALGSVHKVKVATADGKVVRNVVIAEAGAIPPKVEVPAAKPAEVKSAAPPQAPKPPGQGQAPPGPSTSPLRMTR